MTEEESSKVLLMNLGRLYDKTRVNLSKGDVSMVKMSVKTMETLLDELKAMNSSENEVKRMEKQIKSLLKDVALPIETSILPLPNELKQLTSEPNELETFSENDFLLLQQETPMIQTSRELFSPTRSNDDDDDETEEIQTEMVGIAQRLRETTHSIHRQLKDDVSLLNEVEERSSNSLAKVTTQKDRLIQQLSDGIGLWTTILIILVAILSFVVMYILMKIFPKQQ